MPRTMLAAAAAAAALLACGGSDEAADTTAARDAAPDPCADASTQVSPAGIGPLRIGERVGALPPSCGARDTTFTLGEGIMETGSVVSIGGAPVLAMTSGSAEGVVSRIIVEDPAFRTELGVGVGSTVADLRRAQGRICAFEGEGNTVVQAASMPGVSFQIGWSSADAPDELLNEVFGGAEPSAAIDTARITTLWIFENRSACGGS
ncbi:MAG TPA: hypothetical protein VFZ11_13010 [Gemmatimonadaceae bacterium]